MRIIEGFSAKVYGVYLEDADFVAERERVFSKVRWGEDAASAGISRQRYEQLKRYKNQKAMELSLAATMALRAALKEHNLQESRLEYEYNEHGKPFIKGYRNLLLSISHAGNMAVAVAEEFQSEAEAREALLGIDIEETSRVDEKIVSHFFSPGEQRIFAEAEDRAEMFMKIWTAREAFGKAVGSGLALPEGSMEYVPGALRYLGTDFPVEHRLLCEAGERTMCSLVHCRAEE